MSILVGRVGPQVNKFERPPDVSSWERVGPMPGIGWGEGRFQYIMGNGHMVETPPYAHTHTE